MTFAWTNEVQHELVRLWKTGMSAAEIGRLLGCGKNSVISKVRRLRGRGALLPNRPSPIKIRTEDGKVLPRPNGHKPPPKFWNDERCGRLRELWLGGATTHTIAATLKASESAVRNKAKELGLAPRGIPRDTQDKPRLRTPGASRWATCQWPMWGDDLPLAKIRALLRADKLKYCGAKTVSGESWCAAHLVRVDPRRAS